MKVFTEMDFYRYGFLSRTNISFILLSLFHLTAYSCKCLYLTLLVRYMEVFTCMHMGNSASQERMNKELTCKQKISSYIFHNHCPDGCLIHKLMMECLKDTCIMGAKST